MNRLRSFLYDESKMVQLRISLMNELKEWSQDEWSLWIIIRWMIIMNYYKMNEPRSLSRIIIRWIEQLSFIIEIDIQ